MPDFRQRAEDALRHLEAFEEGALADVKAELRKLTAPAAGPPAPAAQAPAQAKTPAGS